MNALLDNAKNSLTQSEKSNAQGPSISKVDSTDSNASNSSSTVVGETTFVGEEDFKLAENDFWDRTYHKLRSSEKTVLFQSLRSTFHREPLAQEYADQWPSTQAIIDIHRQKYYAKIMEQIELLDNDDQDQKERWTSTMLLMQAFWDKGIVRSIRQHVDTSIVADGKADKTTTDSENSDSERSDADVNGSEQIGRLLKILNWIALENEKDNTLSQKQGDQQAWFGIVDRLLRNDQESIRNLSTGDINYGQLFEQPEFYRGKVVHFSGKVRLAYWLKASDNPLGVERYFVYWVRPEDGSNNPIVIYSLQAARKFSRNQRIR